MEKVSAGSIKKCLLILSFIILAHSFDYLNQGRDWNDGVCATGTQQSPIDIVISDAKPLTDNDHADYDLKLDYVDFYAKEVDLGFDGHSYKLSSEHGSAGSMTALVKKTNREHTFQIMLALFHGGSEHALNGQRFDMEMHIVHKQYAETLDRPYAILGVFFRVGESNDFLEAIIEGEEVEADEFFDEEILEYYHYEGSLTYPACDEVVNWYIWNEIQEASQEQIDYLTGARDSEGVKVETWHETYREFQSLNGRQVYQWGDARGPVNRPSRDRESL